MKTASQLKEIMNVRSCVPNIICFQTQKQLAKLNNIWVLLKSVLIDLRASNFVHTKTSLHAHGVHARNCVHNLSSPVFTLSKSYYQTIVNTLREFQWTLEQTENSQSENSRVKVRKVSMHTQKTCNFTNNYSWVYMIGHWWL